MGGFERLVGATYYRYEAITYTNGVSLYCEEYKVIKVTPKGVWISNYFYDGEFYTWKKFILLDAKKQWACDSKVKALCSFIKRKERQTAILLSQLDKASSALEIARSMLATQ